MVPNINNDSQPSAISETDQNNAKNTLLQLVTHLVARHLKNKGTYYESFGESANGVGTVRISKKSAKYIATTVAPYVIWVTASYVSKFYGEDQKVIKFYKKPDEYIPGAYKLNFMVMPNSLTQLPFFMLFLVVAFEDKFHSNEGNKLIINRLSNLIREDHSISENAQSPAGGTA